MPKAKFYNDLKIPAAIFFNNIGSDDLSFLIIEGKPTEHDLVNAWDELYDSYFEKKKDNKAKLILKTKNNVAILTYKITLARNLVKFLATHPLLDDERLHVIKQLKKLKINIDPKKDIIDEVHRVVVNQIPGWETRLNLEINNLEKLSKGKSATFEAMIDAISDAKGYPFSEDVSLIRYLEAEEKVIAKSKQQQQKKRNRNGR